MAVVDVPIDESFRSPQENKDILVDKVRKVCVAKGTTNKHS